MENVETLKCSVYPSLKETIEKVRESEPLAVSMPVTGKSFDNALIRRCQRTIDKGIYLVVLEDMTMFYIENDLNQ